MLLLLLQVDRSDSSDSDTLEDSTVGMYCFSVSCNRLFFSIRSLKNSYCSVYILPWGPIFEKSYDEFTIVNSS